MKIPIFFKVGLFLTALAATLSLPLAAYSADDADVGDLKEKQKKIEKKIKKEEAKVNILKSRARQLDGTINTVRKKVLTIKEQLDEIDREIDRRKKAIADYRRLIELRREILAGIVRQMRRSEISEEFLSPTTKERKIPAMGAYADYLDTLRARAVEEIRKLDSARKNLEKEKKRLAQTEEEKKRLLSEQEKQKRELIDQKNQVVQEVRQKEATIAELRKELQAVASRLSRLTAKKYNTNDIKKAIKFAAKKTGVREGFLFGMISMESGGNPRAGRCNYKNAGMSKVRKIHFKNIVEALNKAGKKYDRKKLPVSCAPRGYPGSGGAMGVAQFMPDTWVGYASRISAVTGNYPPDPWSLTDGVVAMALKLKNDGATRKGKVRITLPPGKDRDGHSCEGRKVKVKWEIYASMRYLGWSCYGYYHYAPGIQNLAKNYSKL